MENNGQQPDFESVKTRLAEIAEAVDDETLSLDDALDLYEEAVALGLKASDLLETGIVVPEETDGAEPGEPGEQPEAGQPEVGQPAGQPAEQPAGQPEAEQSESATS